MRFEDIHSLRRPVALETDKIADLASDARQYL